MSLGFGSASLLCLGSGIADTFKMSLLIPELTNGVHGDTLMAAVFVSAAKTFETRDDVVSLLLHNISLERVRWSGGMGGRFLILKFIFGF